MQTAHMDLNQAKYAFSREWGRKTANYNLSTSDSFTDGFWDGRLWAAARVLDAFPELDRDLVVELLGITQRECKEQGI